MKKILSFFLIISLAIDLFGQAGGGANITDHYFDPQPQNFLKQLQVIVKENQRDELVEFYNNMEKEIKAGKISEGQLNKMVDILNKMYVRRMQVWPYYRNFMIAATNATKSGYDEAFLDRWYLFTKGILETSKKGNNRDFATFMDFSNDLFLFNALVSDKSKNYIIGTKDLSFKFNGGKILVEVPQTNLKGFFQKDTISIFNTSGTYNVMDHIWTSSGGRTTWLRVGIPEAECYATFGNYAIDMNRSEYKIDSAILYYPEYFPTKVYGILSDKITKEKDSSLIQYPNFEAYGKKFMFDKKVAPNVKLSGGFSMKGNDVVIGSDFDAPAILQIYDQSNAKKLFSAEGYNCLFRKGSYVKVARARIKIFAGNDSITHPYCDVKYDVAKNELTILKEETGIGKARFRSGFHKLTFDAELLTWKLDQDELELKMLVGRGENAAKFISENNFDQQTYDQATTAAESNNPILILLRLAGQNTNLIPLDDFVKAFGPSFSRASVLPELFVLEKFGFVSYLPSEQMVKVNKELIEFYSKANSKKVDYDLMNFKSYGNKYVAKFNMKSKKIDVVNVKRIPFNDSAFVYAFPSDTGIVEITDLRKLKFDGKVMAGRLDIFGKDYKFNYDSFTIKSDQISKVKIHIADGEDPLTRKEIQVALRSTLEKVDGQIFINGRFNRSGRETAKQYPKMTTFKNSYVYYDHPNIFRGIYNRDNFYFEVSPFKKDSLLFFEASNLNYSGKLFSAGIFQPFEESLRVQQDLSLGFQMTTKGLVKNYGSKGQFEGGLSLSNTGLIGKGKIKYQSAEMESDSIHYFPEFTSFMAKKVAMDKQKVGTEYPQMTSDSSLVAWKPLADSMLMKSTKGHPFDMYENSTKMHGMLLIEPTGLSGRGFLDFPEAIITSDDMRFKADIMTADTSSMEIKSMGNKITFKTPNVRARMDFVQKIGDFKSNSKDISTDFAYNQYKANINEFRWDMNKKILTFKPQEASRGMRFTSTHPIQDSLSFYVKTAEYNMITSIIKMDGVDEIMIADCRVIPDNGKVNIFPDAKMETLKNAIIEGDTLNMYHTIEKATLDIHGRNDMIGTGTYNLKIQDRDYPIKLTSIKVAKVEKDYTKRNKNEPTLYTVEGTGKVQKSEDLKIYRNTDFYGDVKITMNRKLPYFTGSQRIEFMTPTYKSPWFGVDNEINVAQLEMYKKELKDQADNQIYTGFMIDRANLRGLYTVILGKARSDSDAVCFDGRGLIKHLSGTNNYVFGDTGKINSNALAGNRIDYNDSSGILVAEGKMNAGLRLSGIPVTLAGTTQNVVGDSTYKFFGGLGTNITFDPRLMQALTNFMIENFAVNKDIQYNKKETRKAMGELFHPRDLLQVLKETEASLTIQSPPKLSTSNFIFTDLVMEYDATDMAWRSKPEFGMSIAGNRPLNKMTFGHIELGYGEYFDNFTVFMQSKMKEWVYISFAEGILSLATSSDDVNSVLNTIEPRKRIVRKSEKEYYTYTSASNMEIDAFRKRMSKGGKYDSDEQRFKHEEKKEVDESDVKEASVDDGKSEELKKIEADERAADSAEEAELKRIEKEEDEKDAKLEAEKKAKAETKANLEEVDTDDEAPEVSKVKKEETPSTTQKPVSKPEERENAEETPEEKKDAEPEKKINEGQSLFDSF
jgi:hypothetical protein